ncbi:MAG: hypothetical protein L6R00_07330 [Phycisphaerae bacterium]|nr:hypothetical protein [Phycisphaerae bacterium]
MGDGKSDEAVVPRLVERILGTGVAEDARGWARLHGSGRGYHKKLRFAILAAKDSGAAGVVATIDRDRDRRGARLKALREGRAQHRGSAPPFPTAIGEAVPHLESWLLDDPIAVRRALRLPDDHKIPSPTRVDSPKETLERMWRESEQPFPSASQMLAAIARHVDTARCSRSQQTGFGAFRDDVVAEIGPLVSAKA